MSENRSNKSGNDKPRIQECFRLCCNKCYGCEFEIYKPSEDEVIARCPCGQCFVVHRKKEYSTTSHEKEYGFSIGPGR